MATPPMPSPDQGQGAAPNGGGPAPGPPQQGQPPDQGQQQPPDQSSFQAPGNPLQILLAKWGKVAEQMAAADPRLASGAQKVREGIQEMQTAIVTPPQPTPMAQQPKY